MSSTSINLRRGIQAPNHYTVLALSSESFPGGADPTAGDGQGPTLDDLPTFETPVQRLPISGSGRPACLPESGEHLGDFELLRVLGAGSFARVFLARQVSLGRRVALKVSACRGSEARTLAGLEHDHIVRVFSE